MIFPVYMLNLFLSPRLCPFIEACWNEMCCHHELLLHIQAYYRRADALIANGKIKEALSDYKRAVQLAPKDPDLRKKFTECQKQVKQMRIEESLSSDSTSENESSTVSLSHLCFPVLSKLCNPASTYLRFKQQNFKKLILLVCRTFERNLCLDCSINKICILLSTN